MKKVFILFLFLFSLSGFTEPKVKWISLEEAQNFTLAQSKPILIDFTADWCGWCKVMDKKTFSDESVATYMNEKFYTVKLDYDSTEKLNFFGEQLTARELGEKYRVSGLPTILLLSSDSKKSKKLVGYKTPEPFLKSLKAAKL